MHSKTEIKRTEKKGRGVFATEDIIKDELIEKCETIIFTQSDADTIDKTVIWQYYFAWDHVKYKGALCLGNGSLYNHSKINQNAEYYQVDNQLHFYATKDIKKGEEILIDYGPEFNLSEP